MKNNLLKKLNEMEIIDFDFDGTEVIYIHIEDNENNRKCLKELGATDTDITDMVTEHELLDITDFAFKKCGADWYKPTEGFY